MMLSPSIVANSMHTGTESENRVIRRLPIYGEHGRFACHFISLSFSTLALVLTHRRLFIMQGSPRT